jgi:hypothetical protein
VNRSLLLASLVACAHPVARPVTPPPPPASAPVARPELDDPARRASVLRTLEAAHDPGTIGPLGEAWRRNDRSSQILRTMIQIADADGAWKDAVPYLADAVTSYSPDNDRSVDDARIACDALGRARAAATQKLPKAHVGNRVRLAAIRALGAFPTEPRVTPALVGILETDPDAQPPQLAGAAAMSLADIHDPAAVPALVRALLRTDLHAGAPGDCRRRPEGDPAAPRGAPGEERRCERALRREGMDREVPGQPDPEGRDAAR